jgi:hypothetical protein
MNNDDPIKKTAAGLKVADPSKGDLPFAEAAERWWDSDPERRDGRSVGGDRLRVRLARTVLAVGPDTPVSSIDPATFRRVRAGMLAGPSRRDGRPPSAPSVNLSLRLALRVLAHVARTRRDIDLSHMPDPSRDDIYLKDRRALATRDRR